MSSYESVQSVARALKIFGILNRTGTATVRDLHSETGIPKPTIIRLLETLMAEGYVYKDHRMGGYQITAKSSVLGAGFHGAPLAIEAARPWAIDLTRQIKWPTAVCTLHNDGMIIRYSTIPDSPISPFHSSIGMKLSLARRGLGLAYLAFCPDAERAALIKRLEASPDPENHFPDPRVLTELIEQTRQRGFAERNFGVEPRSSGTVAMPLKLNDRVLATFGVTYFRSAIAERDLMARIVEPLRTAVANIEREIAQLGAVRERISGD